VAGGRSAAAETDNRGAIPGAGTPLGSLQAANLRTVRSFCAAWGLERPDPRRIVMEFMTADCRVRLTESQPASVGQAAVIALMTPFVAQGEHYDLRIVESFARGPVVVTYRMDSAVSATRTVGPEPVVGVFRLAGGRIQEWIDYPADKEQ
jgi:limonene-1,2-epoxide hydrolase